MRFKITSVCRKENKIWKTQSHKLCQRGRNHNFSKKNKKIVVFKILLTLKCLMVILLQKGQALIVIKLID